MLNFKPMASMYYYSRIKDTIRRAKKYGESRYTIMFFYIYGCSTVNRMFKDHGAELYNYQADIDVYTVYDEEMFESWNVSKGVDIAKEAPIYKEENKIKESLKRMESIAENFGIKPDDFPAMIIYDIITNEYIKLYFQHENSDSLAERIKEIKNVLANNDNAKENSFEEVSKKLNSEIFNSKIDLESILVDEKSFDKVFYDLSENKDRWRLRAETIFAKGRTTIWRWVDDAKKGDFRAFSFDRVIALAIALECNSRDCNRLLEACKFRQLKSTGRDGFIMSLLDDKQFAFDNFQEELINHNYKELSVITKKTIKE